jgi:hypothetical protein
MRSQAVDFMPQQIFHREVERQCKFALMAYEDLKQALAVIQQPAPRRPTVNSADVAQVQESMAKYAQWQAALEKYLHTKAAATDRLWYAVQAFLVAAGNVSKLLWPSDKPLLPKRGPELRASLQVEEDSPLKPRTFRNHFEHFDARIEEWAVSSEHRVFIDSNIGPVDRMNFSGAEPGDYLRNFDPSDFTVTFRGDRYCLPPIADAIEWLWPKATVRLQQRASA